MSLLLSFLALASFSAEAAPAPAPAVAKPADEKVCKSITVTGSRLGRRKVCAKKSEWDAQAREAEKTAQDSTRPAPPPPSN